MKITYWNAYLPLSLTLKGDEPGLDPSWAQPRGVDLDALSTLRLVRRKVIPAVTSLSDRGRLISYSMLVHDRSSGVPCPPEDTSPYIHLRLAICGAIRGSEKRPLGNLLPHGWVYVTEVKPSDAELEAQEMLHTQTDLYFKLIESGERMSDLDLLLHVRKHLHYFANMAQMMVH